MNHVTATIEPAADPIGEFPIALRIANHTDQPIEVLNPDLGRPAESADWAYSVQAYRAALMVSFGFLTLSVHDDSGNEIEQEPVTTWSTPLVPPPVSIVPGGSLRVVIPIGPFFMLQPETIYRINLHYGDPEKVHAEGTLHT